MMTTNLYTTPKPRHTGVTISGGQEWPEAMQTNKRTATRFLTLNPIWKEAFLLRVPRAEAVLRVEIKGNHSIQFNAKRVVRVCYAIRRERGRNTLVVVVPEPADHRPSIPQTTTSPR